MKTLRPGKNHVDMIAPKLSQACYTVRRTKPHLSHNDFMMLFLQSCLTGWFFWRNSTHSDYIFKLQKRIIRVKIDARSRDSCRELFKILKILLLSSQYIFSLAMFVVNNKGLFMENSELYNIRTRNNSNLYQPLSHLAI